MKRPIGRDGKERMAMAQPRRTAEETRALRASLVEHAQRVVERDGASALTMRALASEAGCALGLPYKVFEDREELVSELLHREFGRLGAEFRELVARAGSGRLVDGLVRYAELMLASPALALVDELGPDAMSGDRLGAAVDAVVPAVEGTMREYLAAEKRLGRVAVDVDERAFGFVIAGAIHNLLVSGDAYPRPGMDGLKEMLAAVADRLAPAGGETPGGDG